MGAVSGAGAAGTSGSAAFFSSLAGAGGAGSGFGGRVILSGSRPLICSPYSFLMASHLTWKQNHFQVL